MSDKLKYFIFGVALTLLCFVFISATSTPPPLTGRYQIAGDGTTVYVCDTQTGATKSLRGFWNVSFIKIP